jgi:hypothetical protein
MSLREEKIWTRKAQDRCVERLLQLIRRAATLPARIKQGARRFRRIHAPRSETTWRHAEQSNDFDAIGTKVDVAADLLPILWNTIIIFCANHARNSRNPTNSSSCASSQHERLGTSVAPGSAVPQARAASVSATSSRSSASAARAHAPLC